MKFDKPSSRHQAKTGTIDGQTVTSTAYILSRSDDGTIQGHHSVADAMKTMVADGVTRELWQWKDDEWVKISKRVMT